MLTILERVDAAEEDKDLKAKARDVKSSKIK